MAQTHYKSDIQNFLLTPTESIVGALTMCSTFAVEEAQLYAWKVEIESLRSALSEFEADGSIYLEFTIPRLGSRADVILIVRHVIFVLEYKVGERTAHSRFLDQVTDYALDLRNFHESSHEKVIAPVLVLSQSTVPQQEKAPEYSSNVLQTLVTDQANLSRTLQEVLEGTSGAPISIPEWESGRYHPSPSIVDAAKALYAGHSVADITRSDSGAQNLSLTANFVASLVESARQNRKKVICFVSGVPGAGKTLVGLDVANRHTDRSDDLYSVYLSGNGPLVAILQEALARDKVDRETRKGNRLKKSEARRGAKQFIQNVHHFRDACLLEGGAPPIEHVVIFDEAQRAWNREQTSRFMQRKRGITGFDSSEPEFLISCMDRHLDWTVIVCLVGGGQEINTGEAGMGEWIIALAEKFNHWEVHLSPNLNDHEYKQPEWSEKLKGVPRVEFNEALHLKVSMRSFRAESLSKFVRAALNLEIQEAKELFGQICDRYPIRVTRSLDRAKRWLRERARGSERYGLVVSSQAIRLKPHAIDVRCPLDPIHWFLDDKEDVRSSYYLEDAATEFHIQGLELDWVGVVWDGDLRHTPTGWTKHSFIGSRWNRINSSERQTYLINAYRVLLTRARQGMIIVVPNGDPLDPTRDPSFYDSTFNYLLGLGIPHEA
ncbi:MAG: DUF2075 domain-containing protein [Betaproteobacteria bacterium]|nr:DUF2075 domain-containing protein [Betaproteobacteria bacterium]